MGYYLETPGHNVNKAHLLADQHDGTVIIALEPVEPDWKIHTAAQICHNLMEKFDIVVVVENPRLGFEAAGFAFNHGELDEFMRDSDRRRRWLLMFPKGVAAKLSGYTNEVVA